MLSAPANATQQQKPQERITVHKQTCPGLRSAIVFYRAKVWERQDYLGERHSPTYYPERRKYACKYKKYVLGNWKAIAFEYRKLLKSLSNPVVAIEYVFGQYSQQAIQVSACESRHSINAHNGQYLGLFQMGSSERAKYGHGNTAIEQARAANRYFIASGRDWSPWSCKPWR